MGWLILALRGLPSRSHRVYQLTAYYIIYFIQWEIILAFKTGKYQPNLWIGPSRSFTGERLDQQRQSHGGKSFPALIRPERDYLQKSISEGTVFQHRLIVYKFYISPADWIYYIGVKSAKNRLEVFKLHYETIGSQSPPSQSVSCPVAGK